MEYSADFSPKRAWPAINRYCRNRARVLTLCEMNSVGSRPIVRVRFGQFGLGA